MITRKFHGGALLIAVVQALIVGAMLALPVTASQFPLSNPTSGTLSGLSMVQNYNNAIDAVASCNSGGSAPATQFLSGSPSNSDCWDDTSVSGRIVHRIYMASTWVATAYYDLTDSLYIGIVGGGIISTIASAPTTDLCSVFPAFLEVSTSTGPVTSFGSSCQTGVWKRVTFTGALTLSYNATSLILPTATNIVTAAGDTLDAVALGSGNWIVTNYTRATGAALSSVGLNVGASALTQSAQGFGAPINLQLAASVAGNNLTISVLGVNGSNPSSTNPVLVEFRSQTLNNGSAGVVYGQIAAALSFQVTSLNSMGCTTAVLCRLWVELICQTESSGTCTSILLGVSDQSTATQVFPLAEDALQSTGAGTSGGGTAGVIQTSVGGLSGKAIRIAGYVEVTWTSGTGWATTPSKVQLFGPGVHKPGDVVQTASALVTTTTNAGTSFTLTTITASITPTSAVNLVRAEAYVNGNIAATHNGQITLARGGTAIGPIMESGGSGANAAFVPMVVKTIDNPATASSVTYNIYARSDTINQYVCGSANGSYMELNEIMGALDLDKPPANDDAAPLRLVG